MPDLVSDLASLSERGLDDMTPDDLTERSSDFLDKANGCRITSGELLDSGKGYQVVSHLLEQASTVASLKAKTKRIERDHEKKRTDNYERGMRNGLYAMYIVMLLIAFTVGNTYWPELTRIITITFIAGIVLYFIGCGLLNLIKYGPLTLKTKRQLLIATLGGTVLCMLLVTFIGEEYWPKITQTMLRGMVLAIVVVCFWLLFGYWKNRNN